MKTIATRIFIAVLLATAIASCSTPVLEPTPSNTAVTLEIPQVTDLLNGDTNNASDLVDNGTVDSDTSLQAMAKPCFTYKVKKYVFDVTQSDNAGYIYGTIEATKSPSCKSPLKVSFEGKYTSPNTRPEDRITAYFDNPLIYHDGNKYYCYFDIYLGTHPKLGTYGVAFRVKGGNVNKAVTEVKINVLANW
jgi:hypothetical protein